MLDFYIFVNGLRGKGCMVKVYVKKSCFQWLSLGNWGRWDDFQGQTRREGCQLTRPQSMQQKRPQVKVVWAGSDFGGLLLGAGLSTSLDPLAYVP